MENDELLNSVTISEITEKNKDVLDRLKIEDLTKIRDDKFTRYVIYSKKWMKIDIIAIKGNDNDDKSLTELNVYLKYLQVAISDKSLQTSNFAYIETVKTVISSS